MNKDFDNNIPILTKKKEILKVILVLFFFFLAFLGFGKYYKAPFPLLIGIALLLFILLLFLVILVSDIYLDIIKELGVDNFNQDVQSVEVEELKNRLRQRQFLLEGFNCKVLSEKEMVQFYEQMIEAYGKDIIVWSKKFLQYSDDTIEEYPDGEFPKGEEISEEDVSTTIEIGKYSKTSIALYIIEFDLLKNHQEIVADYYKRLGIPRAAKYAKDMIAFYKEVFTLGI